MQLRGIAAVAAAFVFVANTSAEARRYDNQTERSQSEDDDDRPAVRRKDVGGSIQGCKPAGG